MIKMAILPKISYLFSLIPKKMVHISTIILSQTKSNMSTNGASQSENTWLDIETLCEEFQISNI